MFLSYFSMRWMRLLLSTRRSVQTLGCCRRCLGPLLVVENSGGGIVINSAASLHLSPLMAKKRRQVRKAVVVEQQKSTKEPVDFYNDMTLAYVFLYLNIYAAN